MKRMRAVAVATILAWTGLAGAAAAQLSEQGGPIAYSADNLEYFEGERRLVLTGAVEIVQNEAVLRADRLTLFFAPGSGGQNMGMGSGDVDRMVAEGEVYYVRPQQRARGDRAVYETSTDTVTFTGNVIVDSTDGVIRGETLVLQVGAGRTTVTASEGSGRVRGVVTTDNRNR
jgi:lipopolysaccharide export system protein LptA